MQERGTTSYKLGDYKFDEEDIGSEVKDDVLGSRLEWVSSAGGVESKDWLGKQSYDAVNNGLDVRSSGELCKWAKASGLCGEAKFDGGDIGESRLLGKPRESRKLKLVIGDDS